MRVGVFNRIRQRSGIIANGSSESANQISLQNQVWSPVALFLFPCVVWRKDLPRLRAVNSLIPKIHLRDVTDFRNQLEKQFASRIRRNLFFQGLKQRRPFISRDLHFSNSKFLRVRIATELASLLIFFRQI